MSRYRFVGLLAGMLGLMFAAPAVGAVWFQPTGFLHESFPPQIEAAMTALAPNGTMAVGRDVAQGSFEATRWTPAGGLVGLGQLPGSPVLNSQAFGVSNNGVVTGNGAFGSPMQQAFRWTETTGMVGLGVLPGAAVSQGWSVSVDGSVIVGDSGNSDGSNRLPFRWSQDAGMTSLGMPAGFAGGASATDISHDATVIVGEAGLLPFGTGSWRWTETDGFLNIGSLGGAFPFTRAQGISGDGQVIIGNGYGANGFEAFRWTAAEGMVGLGDLPGGTYSSWANGGVSYDGSIIVGGSQSSEYNSDAFIWDAGHGMRSLKHVLEDEYGLDLTGWNLEEASGLSDDGLTISGWGYNPLGQREGWVAHIPEPASFVLTLVAVGLVLRRR